jgi:cyclohexanone monooxygenase
MEHVQEVSVGSPYTAPSCHSWYVGGNIAGKARVILPYTGGVGRYREICEDIASDSYRGFVLSPT